MKSLPTDIPQTIAIIGGGFSGSMVLYHLLNEVSHLPADSKIFLIDKSNLFNRGIAYAPTSKDLLLNVPAGNMGATPDAPGEFAEWLKNNGYPYAPSDFVPRHLYGTYLSEKLNKKITETSKLVETVFLHDSAISIVSQQNGCVEVHLESGKRILSTQVVLATGNTPPALPAGLKNISRSSKLFNNPWMSLNGLTSDDTVLIVGTGLTAIDVVLDLERSGFKGKLIMLSRHGRLPLPHATEHTHPPEGIMDKDELTSVRSALKWIKNKTKEHSWISVFEALRPHLQTIWLNWNHIERSRFRRVARSVWDIHRHRIPGHVLDAIHQLKETGRLNILGGSILQASERESSIFISFRDRKSGEQKEMKVDAVINCTGPKEHWSTLEDPLLDSLYNAGFLKNKNGLECEVDADHRLQGDKNNTENIYLLGAMLRSQFWESTAVRELRVQAKTVANGILKSLVTN